MMWWWHDGGASWWWVGLGWLWMVAFWGGLIALIVWAIRSLAGPTRSQESYRSPLDIAKARYARGEITREELDEIRKALED